ncbi:MAG: AraC family transcriptional regulator [Hyphomicrobium sp.]
MASNPFNDALEDLRISASVLLHERYDPPWAIEVPSQEGLRAALSAKPDASLIPFHFVRHGAFDLHYDGAKPVRIPTGDVTICPSGAAHRMSFGSKTKAVRLADLLKAGMPRTSEETGHATELICGVFQLRNTPLNPLVAALPRVLSVKTNGAGVSPLLDHAAQMLAIEAAKSRTSFIASRVLEVFFAEAIRAYSQAEGALASGWFKALNDPKIRLALSRMHDHPGAPWTVAALADTIRMSPSRFAARFREVMGQSAMSYVSGWRMTVACQHLRESNEPLDVIAGAVGYQDVASFSRAFKALVGESPAKWRTASRR